MATVPTNASQSNGNAYLHCFQSKFSTAHNISRLTIICIRCEQPRLHSASLHRL